MTTDRIYVCGLDDVTDTLKRARASHLVTLINIDNMIDTPPGIRADNHLRLAMNDISHPMPGYDPPAMSHVKELIEFARCWDRRAPLVVHCWAGISRSTAAAFVALCTLNDGTDEQFIADELRAASRTAHPNRLLVKLADEALGRQGRMVSAIENIGPPEFISLGGVFYLPAQF